MDRLEDTRRAALVTCLSTSDTALAWHVRDAMAALGRRRPGYVRLVATGPGMRLAADVNAGHVAALTTTGRAALEATYVRVRCAAALPADLDANTVVDRITGRRNPRLDHATREAHADAEDRQLLAAGDSPWSPENVARALAATRRILDPAATS